MILRIGDRVWAYRYRWLECVIQTIKRSRTTADALVDDGTTRTWRRVEELIPVDLLDHPRGPSPPRSLGRGMAVLQAAEFWRRFRTAEDGGTLVVDPLSL